MSLALVTGVSSALRVTPTKDGSGIVVRFGLIQGGTQDPTTKEWSGGETTNCVVFEPLASLISDEDFKGKFVACKGTPVQDKDYPATAADGSLVKNEDGTQKMLPGRISFVVAKLKVRDPRPQASQEAPAAEHDESLEASPAAQAAVASPASQAAPAATKA